MTRPLVVRTPVKKEYSQYSSNSPYNLQLHVLNEEGHWTQVKKYERKGYLKETPKKFLFFIWTKKEQYYTESRQAFIDRCIKDAKKEIKAHNYRKAKLQDIIYIQGEKMLSHWRWNGGTDK